MANILTLCEIGTSDIIGLTFLHCVLWYELFGLWENVSVCVCMHLSVCVCLCMHAYMCVCLDGYQI